ncbi:hypothetical protein GCM10009700_27620 [Brevibacterium sanguinis]|uniref:hypothetical protein n=1 Tax=Brevibacterium sanguinis TaxID=232444 RepID=UPI0031D85478
MNPTYFERSAAPTRGAVNTVSKTDVIFNAADLLSDDGSNSEYDSAILQLTARLLDMTSDDCESLSIVLRAIK